MANNNNNYDNYEDFEDMKGKGTKREKRKAKRHNDKKILKDINHSYGIDEDELEDYMDNLPSN